MWLINVDDRRLECFNDERSLPPYAILSHTWTDAEVSMQEYRDSVMGDIARSEFIRQTPGYAKIDATCLRARSDRLSYVWVDTCCIDKTSSAELSEAINSMFRWYQNSQICYVYLVDVHIPDGAQQVNEEQLAKAKWFTRGWTLQELIAPRHMQFFDANWNHLGTKGSLVDILASITRIDSAFLVGLDLRAASIATRMSWAAKRITTKVEDLAYSLFGIFAVNMPLLYGEGTKAFQRLQEEILKETDDQSLFAWQPLGANYRNPPHRLSRVPFSTGISIFAQHPDQFVITADVIAFPSPGEMSLAGGKGLKIELPLFQIEGAYSSSLYVAVLSCVGPSDRRPGDDENRCYRGVILEELCPGHFMRHPTAPLARVNLRIAWDGDSRSIYVCKVITMRPSQSPSYKSHPTRKIKVDWIQPRAPLDA